MGSDPASDSHDEPFPIVGIGASAGALAALRCFVEQVPADSGAAFVIVVHLSPEHESHLEALLQPHTRLPVAQVTATVPIEPDHIYVIPPNANLDTIDTHLRLRELEERRIDRAPIDHFFCTLADNHGARAIGVVLTGTGADGARGLRHIKEKGGLVVVQDPAEAEFDGMPRSALAGVPVDLVLPVARIPEAILQFTRTSPRLSVPDDGAEADPESKRLLRGVLRVVRARTGRDFSRYKRSTLLRRVRRRMQFQQVSEPADYLELVQGGSDEATTLADDLLVTVTSFFRDPEVFEVLERQVVPQLFDARGPDDVLRVWSVGCATGEEAYSLAILLLEEAARREHPPRIHVFASDLHKPSLAVGREGYYGARIESEMSAERLERFFRREGAGYRVRPEVRDVVVFTPHNLLGDPPFSRLDLVSCRNLMIYLQRDLQRQVVELFHYALSPDGYLVLGTSEGIDVPDLFQTVDRKLAIFRKRNVAARELRLPVFVTSRSLPQHGGAMAEPPPAPVEFADLHLHMLERHGPASLLVSPDDRVLHFSTRAGRYLVHPGGAPTTNVYKLVREELQIDLRALLAAARTKQQRLKSPPVDVGLDGDAIPVVLHAQPVLEPGYEGFALVLFDEREVPAQGQPPAAQVEEVRGREVRLEHEQTRQKLQAIIRDYESTQEELRASNEELQSANEELHSALEELETSKEELQSMNEELQTLNQENRHKVEELEQLSSDLQQLFEATDIATLFLDRELRILRFTPTVTRLFSVQSADRGRRLVDFSHTLRYDELVDDAASVLERLAPIQREVRDQRGRWFLSRIVPYRGAENTIAGLVLTFVDITERKQFEDEIREAKEYAEQIIETLPEPLLVLDTERVVQSANAAFLQHFQLDAAQTLGKRIYDLANGEWDLPVLRSLLEEVLPTETMVTSLQIEHTFEHLGRRVMLLDGRQLDHLERTLLGIRDITDLHEAERALRESDQRYRGLAELSPDAIVVTVAGRCVYANEAAGRLLGPDLDTRVRDVLGQQDPCAARLERSWVSEGGERVDVEIVGGAIEWDGQPAVQVVARDITERKRAERALRESQETRYRALFESIDEGFGIVEVLFDGERPVDYRLLEVNPAFEALTGIRDAAGRPMRELAPDHERDWYERFERVAIMGEPVRFQSAVEQLGRHLDMYAFRVGEPEERRVAVLIGDITERMQLEEQLRRTATQLSEASRRKDEYLAMLGHELRNPLGAIRTATELLKRSGTDDPRLQRVTAMLDRQTAHMARLLDGLLEVSRIVRGKVHLELDTVDVASTLAAVAQDRSSEIATRGLELSTELPKDPVWVTADGSRLVQVFDNLVGNAIKFTPSGGRITICLEPLEGEARIVVRDTGVGIRNELLPHVFEAFQQDTQDIARSTGGLGLGLALAGGLVALHDGTITARSDGPNTGAEFEVRLPLAPSPPAGGEPAPGDGVAPRRILVVEDNTDAADVMRDLLEVAGHDVEVVHTGRAALDELRHQRFDIVLCDLGLPGLSGHDVARAIREDPALRELPLVAISGYGQPDDLKRSAEAGFDEHLIKPVHAAVLDAVLARLRGPSGLA